MMIATKKRQPIFVFCAAATIILRTHATFITPAPWCHRLKSICSSTNGRSWKCLGLAVSDDNKEEEIAKLEAKLRQLRLEIDEPVKPEIVSREEVISSSRRDSINLPLIEMKSESWRESESMEKSENVASSIVPWIGVIVAVVLFSLFAQVPIGQEDFTRYAAVKTSTEIDLGDLNLDRVKTVQGF